MLKTKAQLKMNRLVAFCALLCFVVTWSLPAQAAKIRYRLNSWDGQELRVFVTRPVGLAEDRPVVFVMHGSERSAQETRDQCHDLALEQDFLLVVPEFRDTDFPGLERHEQGNVMDNQGRLRAGSNGSFPAIDTIFDDVRSRFGMLTETYSLYGYTEGAQTSSLQGGPDSVGKAGCPIPPRAENG